MRTAACAIETRGSSAEHLDEMSALLLSKDVDVNIAELSLQDADRNKLDRHRGTHWVDPLTVKITTMGCSRYSRALHGPMMSLQGIDPGHAVWS